MTAVQRWRISTASASLESFAASYLLSFQNVYTESQAKLLETHTLSDI